MAEVAALEIQIGANVDKAVAGVQQFDKSLFQLQEQLKTFKAAQETTFDPKQFVQYGQQINQITQQIESRFKLLESEVKGAGQAMKIMGKTSSSATNSLFALSGIVQDAPFGFRAIANNITFFSQEMAYSVKAAGGFKAALSALGGAMLGPAGIIFAISGITSLLTVFFGNTTKAKKATDDLTESVGTLSTAMAEGDKNAQKDLVHLQLLYKAATDTNRSMKERLTAVRALQKEYPSYLGNQSQENILTGKAALAYQTLKDQILATARARAAENELVKNNQQQLQIEAKLADLEKQRNDLQIKQNSLAANSKAISGLNALSQTGDIATGSMVTLGQKIGGVDDQIKDLRKQLDGLKTASQNLANNVNAVDLTSKPGSGEKTGKKSESGDSLDILKRRAAFNLNNVLASTNNEMRAFAAQSSEAISEQLVPALGEVTKKIQTIQPLVDQLDAKVLAFTQDLAKGLVQGFEGVFSAIANGQNSIQVITQAVEQLIIKLAAAAAAAAILSILSGGSGALAGSIGKLFGGGGFTNIFKGLTGIPLASGGIAYGPTHALVGEYAGARTNPEVIAPLDKLMGMLNGQRDLKVHITGEFKQKARDMVAVIDTYNVGNKRRNG